MTRHTNDTTEADERRTNGSDEASWSERSILDQSRRDFLKATAGAGAVTAGLASGTVGSAAAAGIPTPWLHRDGNLIRDPDGNRVILRGVNIPDPSRLNADNYYSYDVEDYVTWATNGNSPPGTTDPNGWYSRIVRIPAQPVDVGDHDPGGAPPAPAFDQAQLDSYVQNHLRPAVDFCAQRGVYCIVDYHRHRGKWDENLWFTSDAIDDELRLFWNTVAAEFAADSHVLYEVYNEPTEPYPDEVDPAANNQAALDAWNQWKSAAQPWVDVIRSHAPDNLILVGSPRWSQWTAQAPRNEFDGSNLAYTGHVYGQEGLQPFSEYFGAPAEEVPVFLTEWGYKTGRAPYLAGTTDVEGQMYQDLFDDYPIHPVPWIFDFRWVPQFFDRESRDDWQLLRNNDTHGGLVKDLLYENRNSDIPGGGGGTGDTTAPSVPTNLAATDQTSSSITVSWDASTDSGGSGLAHYNVVVDGSLDQQVAAGTTSATASGLSSDTSYQIAVSAVDGAGNESGTATITASTDAGGGGDTTAPTPPSNLSVTWTTSSSIDVDWDASSDSGGSGLDHYAVFVDGSQDQQVAAGTTSASVSGLVADTSYTVGVSAVDGAGNESSTATVSATTDTDGGAGDALLVNDYDGSPAWPGSNDLGNWNGAGGLQNGGGDGEVVGGALRLEYDPGGWFKEKVAQDVSAYSTVNFRVRGDAGGEETQFSLSLGGVEGTLASMTSDSIGTSFSRVSVDMAANGIDAASPGELEIDFWGGSNDDSGAIEIDRIRFE